MTKEILNNKIMETPEEEAIKIENDIRSKLRYSWQRSIAFAISYKPTIQEVMEELENTFLAFIPKVHRKFDEYRRIINESFRKILGKLYTSKDISSLELENEFIDLTMQEIRKKIL